MAEITTILSMILVFFCLRRQFILEKKKRSKLLSQKKSSEVVLGQISEQIAPFLENFPIQDEIKELTFLGMPIDYIHFGEEEITFVEVKSGNSRLSKKQRHIRDLIKDGKVSFVTHRIK